MAAPRTNHLGVLLHAGLGTDSAEDPAFERRLELLAARHPVVTVTQVLDALEGGHALPPHSVLLVFLEEGNFLQHTWKALRARRWAAVLCLAPERALALANGEEPSRLPALVEEGLVLGLRAGGSGPSGDGEGGAERAALAALQRVFPGSPRVLAHPEATGGAGRIALLRAIGFELGITRQAGGNDLRRRDPLRLRSLLVAPGETPETLGVRLASLDRGAAEPPTREEHQAERARRAARRRLRFLARPLDAVLTATTRPRVPLLVALRVLPRRAANYERLRGLLELVLRPLPPLERGLRRALLDARSLALHTRGLELLGHGTAATVFRLLGEDGRSTHVLKVYRWTLGQPANELLRMARRHLARYRLLHEGLGDCLLRTHFLVLNGPLRGLPVAACLQEHVGESFDLLAHTEPEILAYVRTRPGLRSAFLAFVQRLHAFHARGYFPDLLGPANLLVVERAGQASLRLIDYGLFDLRCDAPRQPREAVRASLARFERLRAALEAENGP